MHIYRVFIYVFYFMHLNTFFWEGVRRFHQNLKGVSGTKMFKNSCCKSSLVERFQASAAVYLSPLFFCGATWRVLTASYWNFRTACRSQFQVSWTV